MADIITNRILYPPRIDELGADHPSGTAEYVVTGTSSVGLAQSNTCSDYASTGLQVDYGYPYSGVNEWTASGSTIACSQPSHLYCFGIDRAVQIPPLALTGRLAFVSTGVFAPSGGLAGAHAFCANEASGAGLPGTFLALIAMSASSAKSRFTLGTPWTRVDGVVVTSDLATLAAPIDRTASGQPLSGMVWTGGGTTATIASTTTTCVDWTSSLTANVGIYGLSARSSGDFFGVSNLPCSSTMHHVYCLQQ
jgi:hypothetical protein